MIQPLASALVRSGLHPTADEVADVVWLGALLHRLSISSDERSSPAAGSTERPAEAAPSTVPKNPALTPASPPIESAKPREPAEIPIHAAAGVSLKTH